MQRMQRIPQLFMSDVLADKEIGFVGVPKIYAPSRLKKSKSINEFFILGLLKSNIYHFLKINANATSF